MAGPRSGEDLRGTAPTVEQDGIRVYKPGDQNEAQWHKILLYGPPGVGKTTLAASASAVPAMSEVLMVNVEGGMLSISDPSVYGAKAVPDTTDFTGFMMLDKIFKYLHRGDHKYKTVVIDSLSELVKYNLDAIIEDKMNRGAKNRDKDDVFLEDYGTSTKQMRRVVRMFRDLPMHVVFTCHDAPESNDEGAIIGPALSRSLRKSVEGYMDVIGYMYMGEKKEKTMDDGKEVEKSVPVRRLLTSPTSRFTAKDRSPGQRLGRVTDEPTMTILMAKIHGNKN